MSTFLFLWRWRKVVGAVLAVAAVAYAVWGYGRDKYEAGYDSGYRDVQVKWDADSEARAAEVERVRHEHERRAAETRTRNVEIISEYQKQVSRIAADRDSIASRLHDYQARERAVPAGADQPRATGASPEPGGAGEVDQALDAYDRACRQDAEQLDALIRQLRQQLDTRNGAG